MNKLTDLEAFDPGLVARPYVCDPLSMLGRLYEAMSALNRTGELPPGLAGLLDDCRGTVDAYGPFAAERGTR